MRSDRAGRAALLGLLLLAGTAGAARAAGPSKAEPARKSFDYSRPAPAEILPNPETGIGSPPQLREYVPTDNTDVPSGMGASAGAPAGPPPATPPASRPPATSPAAPATAASAAQATAAPGAPPSPPPAVPPPAPAALPPSPAPKPAEVRALFAAAVTRSGLGASLPFEAAGPVASDPAARDAEARLWSRLAESLAAARADWEHRHPDRMRDASGAVDAVLEPGRAVLVGAPSRVTGAFDDGNP